MRKPLSLMSLVIAVSFLFGIHNLRLEHSAAAPAVPLAGPTERVSIRPGVSEGNQDSARPDISADGRYVAFESDASNLVNGDTNGVTDIFVHDRESNVTSRVSVRSNGAQADFASSSPAISADGRYVVFDSWASNLADIDGGFSDIFIHDRWTHTTELVNVVIGGTADDVSYDPDVSGDGRYVTFQSAARNLIGGDSNEKFDIFRYDRHHRVMARVSLDSNEVEANDSSSHPSISADGQRIAFQSLADNLVTGDSDTYEDVFVRDMIATTTQRISITPGNLEAKGDSWKPFMGGEGKHVVYTSLAADIVHGDNNGQADVFIRDLVKNFNELASIATNSNQGNTWSEFASVTADGRYVAFQSAATTIVPGDPDNSVDLFVRDRQDQVTVRVSISSAGVLGNQSSGNGVIAADGRYVTFDSSATNLISGDGNNKRDVFVHDMDDPPPPPPPPVSLRVNHTVGAPGSLFAFSGENFLPSSPVEVRMNGVFITGTITADAGGRLGFLIRTLSSTPEGGYFATVIQGHNQVSAGFILDKASPTRPAGGSGRILDLPSGIVPLTEFSYLPAVFRR